MSPCPKCGAAGLHEAVLVRFDQPFVWIGHLCPNSACGETWRERANDDDAVLAKAGLQRTTNGPEGGGD